MRKRDLLKIASLAVLDFGLAFIGFLVLACFCTFPENITSDVLVYSQFSEVDAISINEILEFCNENNYNYNYNKNKKVIEIETDNDSLELEVKDGKLMPLEKKHYLIDAIFLIDNPDSYEEIDRDENVVEYKYKNIIKEEKKEDNEKVSISYYYDETIADFILSKWALLFIALGICVFIIDFKLYIKERKFSPE